MLPSGAWQGAVARIVAADPVVDHLRATEAGRGLVRRYVPGRHPADAVEAALEVRRAHRWATLVRLAEPPTSPEDVAKTIQAYAAALRLLARGDRAGVGRATITVLPQALGLALPSGRTRALDAARALALAAAEVDTSLVIGWPERTEVTSGRWLAEQLRVDFPATGVSVRADLPRHRHCGRSRAGCAPGPLHLPTALWRARRAATADCRSGSPSACRDPVGPTVVGLSGPAAGRTPYGRMAIGSNLH